MSCITPINANDQIRQADWRPTLQHVIARSFVLQEYPEGRGGRPADILIDAGAYVWVRSNPTGASNAALYTPVAPLGDTTYKALPADAIEDKWGPVSGLHLMLPFDRKQHGKQQVCPKCGAYGYGDMNCLFCHIHWADHSIAVCPVCSDALSHSFLQP